MVTGDNGILKQAVRAKEKTDNAKQDEADALENYEQYIEGLTNGGTLTTVTGNEESNTKVKDSLGNVITVPAGFRVVNPGDNVEDGIVIEDVNHEETKGSQFVWIPVGEKIKRKDGTTFDIILGRYNFDSITGKETEYIGPFIENTVAENKYDNIPAKNITDFLSKVNSTGGYYIGRYEARDGETDSPRTESTSDTNKLVCTDNNFVYNYVTQPQAAELSKNMYNDTNFESDLVNSYAFDTTLVFLQKCDNRKDASTPYSLLNSLNTGNIATLGTNNLDIKDIICNIFDIASNCAERTTEYSGMPERPCTNRGGCYAWNNESSLTSSRGNDETIGAGPTHSFRPILYL